MELKANIPVGPIEKKWQQHRFEMKLVNPANKRKHTILVVGTGGLSHQLDGTRAGFINRDFDQMCMAKIVEEPDALGAYSIPELVELAGTQGVELLNWLVARAALGGRVSRIHSNYHVPISNTASGMMVLEHRS